MQAETETRAQAMPLTKAVDRWLSQFERALTSRDEAALNALFERDCHWRDLLALTWRLKTTSGIDRVVASLLSAAPATGFAVDPSRTPPRRVMRAGRDVIEALIRFEARDGSGIGVLRLSHNKAWTLTTVLDQVRGFEESDGRARHDGKAYSRDFRGPNWFDLRKQSADYKDRDPQVLVVGAGQAGLAVAARLKQLNVDALIVDRAARIGDNWRNRYHALVLHNQTHVNHMPYMPFPNTWPTYIPKDKLAAWFESYVEAMELNVWTGTTFEGGSYESASQTWSVRLRRSDGTTRQMQPRHVIMATGVSGIPNIPDIPSLKDFTGTVLHSSRYASGEEWRGRRALVVGTGNSGHDIAQDLHSAGASVTIVQRAPTLVTQIEPSAQMAYALYDEGPSTDDCDLIVMGTPLALGKTTHIALTRKSKEMDKPLLDALERVGFKLDDGDGGTGWQFKYLTRGGGYYFNVGCSDLIASGAIKLLQFDSIAKFVTDGAQLRDGSSVKADLVVLATGYKPQEELVRTLFGDDVAARVGPIWGFGDDQELNNMFCRTGQPGLWFIAGSLAQCRIFSKILALQIKACEAGLLDPDTEREARTICSPPARRTA